MVFIFASIVDCVDDSDDVDDGVYCYDIGSLDAHGLATKAFFV